MRNVLPINMMGMAMGLHVRCGIEDNLWNQSRTAKMSTVQQIEQLVRISREFGREVANGKEAREICKIGVFYDTRRRDAGRQRLRAQRQGPAAGLPAQGRLSADDGRADRPDRAGPARPRREHWQTLLAARLRARCGRGAADGPRRPRLRRARGGDRARSAGDRRADDHRRAQRRLHHGGALGAADARAPVRGALLADAARLRAADARGLPDARRAARRRLAAGAARAAAVSEHRRGQPQRPAGPLSSASPSWRATGAAGWSTSARSAT